MKKKFIVLFILLNLFIPFVNAENATVNESILDILDVNASIYDINGTNIPPLISNNQNGIYEKEVNNYHILIDDSAGLLTSSEIELLAKDMEPLTQFGNIIFKTTDTNNYSAEAFASNYIISKYGEKTNGSIFLIDMYNRKIAIASRGANADVITNSKSDIITSNVYREATYEKYYSCAKKAFEQMYTILDGGRIAEPMRYFSNITLSLVIAFFIGFFVILSKSKIKNPTDKEILKNCDVKFEVSNVVGVKTGTHRVYDPPSSSGSSSGGFSGGGGGGGFSGGGSSGSHGF